MNLNKQLDLNKELKLSDFTSFLGNIFDKVCSKKAPQTTYTKHCDWPRSVETKNRDSVTLKSGASENAYSGVFFCSTGIGTWREEREYQIGDVSTFTTGANTQYTKNETHKSKSESRQDSKFISRSDPYSSYYIDYN